MKTKVCKKCNVPFPLSTKINGKTIQLYKRTFCLTCSPYGSHNTIDLSGYVPEKKSIQGILHKSCRICKTLKPITEFYSKSEWGRRYAVCSSCVRNTSKERRREFKQWCIEYKGGSCVVCKYNKCLRSMDFHHLDESEKDYDISTKWKTPKEEIVKELDKCVLVCRNCHGEVHDGITSLP